MPIDFDFSEIVKWVVVLFPSLTMYMKFVVPLGVLIISIVGIFSNILPPPNHQYEVPDLEDVKATLRDNGKIAYYFTRITMFITEQVNIIIESGFYAGFYSFTQVCDKLFAKLRKSEAEVDETQHVSKPVPLHDDLDPFPDPIDKKLD